MPDLTGVIYWSAVGLVALVTLFVVGLLALRGTRGHMRRKMNRRLARVEQILQRHGEQEFAQVERLLFELGQVDDSEAVERALNEMLEQEGVGVRPRLRSVYQALGLSERYLDELSEASGWARRAGAAKALGLLGSVDAIPKLLHAMRQEHEDDAVKQAAARALAQMKADEAIPWLIAELSSADDWASPRLAELLVDFGERALEPLLQALNDEEHANARVWAAQIVGRVGDRQATTPLVNRLQDRSERVRLSVAEALGRIGDRAAVGELTLIALRDPVPTVRAEAARALGAIGDPSVLEELRLLLSANDYWTRRRAVEAIEKLAPEDTFPLEQALGDESPVVRAEAARALERLGVLERWRADLESADGGIADLAERRLIDHGRAGSVESMLVCADHTDLRVRARICSVLAEVGDPAGVEVVERLLCDEMWPVRVRAVEALGKMRPEGAAGRLVPLLSDDEEMVRVAAVGALQGIGLQNIQGRLAALREMYQHGNAEARCGVIDSIENVPEQEVADLVAGALGDPNPEVRTHALRLVERRRSARWTGQVVERLSDADPDVRRAAGMALAANPQPEAVQAMAGCIETDDAPFRDILTDMIASQGAAVVRDVVGEPDSLERGLALVEALGKTGDAVVRLDLERLGGDGRPEIRTAAATALGRLRTVEAIPALQSLCADPSENVRTAAVDALGEMGAEVTVPGLLEVACDPSLGVRQRVALALGKIGGEPALRGLQRLLECNEEGLQAWLVVAFGMTGTDRGRAVVLSHMRDERSRRAVESVLHAEGEEMTLRFRTHLSLDANSGTGNLSPQAMAEAYLHRLRNSRDENERLDALRALCALGPATLARHLMEALSSDPAPRIRMMAAAGLAPLLRDEQVRVAVTRALADPAAEVQEAAVAALGQMQDPAHNDALLRCSALSNPQVAAAIVQALARANEKRVPELTDELMGYAHEQVQIVGATVLGEIGDAAGQSLLRRLAHSGSVDLRAASLRALGKLGTLDAVESIGESAGDPNETVRAAAAEALAGLPLGATVEPLRRLMQDPSLAVRRRLALRLGEVEDARALDLLDELGLDPAQEVRIAALEGFLRLATPVALERFGACHERQPEGVRAALRGKAARSDLTTRVARIVREHRQARARRLALQTLSELRAPLAEPLNAALQDPAVEVRVAAVKIAAALDDKSLVDRLETLLDDPHEKVREAVRKARLSLVPAAGD